MELKLHTELIEESRIRSNRTFMELKFGNEILEINVMEVLIAPLWNWNNKINTIRTYIPQLIAHQLISACTTGVGRAHISCYASAQQLLCGWRYRLLRLITLILPATSKGYSEDFLRKTDATVIVFTSNRDSTYKVQRRYWEVAMIVLTRRKAACSAYCLTMAQHCPLPGRALKKSLHRLC